MTIVDFSRISHPAFFRDIRIWLFTPRREYLVLKNIESKDVAVEISKSIMIFLDKYIDEVTPSVELVVSERDAKWAIDFYKRGLLQ
jgi:hypothetical protein